MTWQGVPWALGAVVGVQAPETPAEAARALAHLAIGGLEGPSTPGDCAVVPRAVPSGGVLVRKGTIGILNRFPGGLGQAYIGRNVSDDDVAIGATGVGTTRTDLIAVVVEDAQYAGQPAPADPESGPFIRTRVFTNVPANTKKLSQVAPNIAGVALARVTLPPSTGTVNAGHITDLRKLPNPRTKTIKRTLEVGDKGAFDNLNAAAFEKFPQAAEWTIEVPLWATTAQLELRVTGARVSNDGTDAGTFRAKSRVKLGGLTTAEHIIDPEIPAANKGNRFAYSSAGEVAITEAMRGTDQVLTAQAQRVSFTSGVEVREAAGTHVVVEVRFIEEPNLDTPESFV